jgi:hypothetical protein
MCPVLPKRAALRSSSSSEIKFVDVNVYTKPTVTAFTRKQLSHLDLSPEAQGLPFFGMSYVPPPAPPLAAAAAAAPANGTSTTGASASASAGAGSGSGVASSSPAALVDAGSAAAAAPLSNRYAPRRRTPAPVVPVSASVAVPARRKPIARYAAPPSAFVKGEGEQSDEEELDWTDAQFDLVLSNPLALAKMSAETRDQLIAIRKARADAASKVSSTTSVEEGYVLED